MSVILKFRSNEGATRKTNRKKSQNYKKRKKEKGKVSQRGAAHTSSKGHAEQGWALQAAGMGWTLVCPLSAHMHNSFSRVCLQ